MSRSLRHRPFFTKWGNTTRVVRNPAEDGGYQAAIRRVVERVVVINNHWTRLTEEQRSEIYEDLVIIAGERLELILSDAEKRERRVLLFFIQIISTTISTPRVPIMYSFVSNRPNPARADRYFPDPDDRAALEHMMRVVRERLRDRLIRDFNCTERVADRLIGRGGSQFALIWNSGDVESTMQVRLHNIKSMRSTNSI